MDENGGEKKEKVTTFKLTEDLTRKLDLLSERDSCTKDAMIRRLIAYGLLVDEELQRMIPVAVKRVTTTRASPKIKVQG